MKVLKIAIGIVFTLALLLYSPQHATAQGDKVRASLKASVSQTLGVDTQITIVYSRPGVKDREIWGGLEPYGMSGDPAHPWRAGANENTTFETTGDILIEGKKLPAGKYGLHVLLSDKDWTIIFSKNNSSWGSFAYKEAEDALRVTVTPVKTANQEWLVYGFEELAGTSATAFSALGETESFFQNRAKL